MTTLFTAKKKKKTDENNIDYREFVASNMLSPSMILLCPLTLAQVSASLSA